MSKLSHTTELRVRYAETDQMGVVYYANYYVWMEVARSEFVRSIGVEYSRMEQGEGLLLAVVESNCRYLRPARYDDLIAIETTVGEVTPRIVEFVYEMRNQLTGDFLAKGSTKHIWLNRDWRPERLPQPYLGLLRGAAGLEDTPNHDS